MKTDTLMEKYLREKKKVNKWSNKVKTKWHPPEGLFKNGSPEEIASTVSQGVDLKTAMARLNFFLNRGGSNISPAIRKKVEKAKDILSSSKE
jgi:hypothetical protein